MRLGQLARRLGISPGEVIDFLIARQIALPDGSNSKLEQDHVLLVIQQFAPDKKDVILEPQLNKEEQSTESSETQSPTEAPAVSAEITHEDIPLITEEFNMTAEVTVPWQPVEEKAEVIKAPKVELPGLKVVGKIDLPDLKKKDNKPAVEGVQEEQGAPAPEEKKERHSESSSFKRHAKKKHSQKNSIALQREREQREAEKKKRLQAKLEKQRRTQHYLKKVKPSVPTKPARLFAEDTISMSRETMATPKGLWQKFLKWFWRQE